MTKQADKELHNQDNDCHTEMDCADGEDTEIENDSSSDNEDNEFNEFLDVYDPSFHYDEE